MGWGSRTLHPSSFDLSIAFFVLQVNAFKNGSKWRVLVASYENIRKHCALLQGCIDLLICDEGHRLKSSGGNNTMTALQQLNCVRRVIMTGTPVQNNLRECAAVSNRFCRQCIRARVW
jgi:DNA repair and recombination protein RAD54B